MPKNNPNKTYETIFFMMVLMFFSKISGLVRSSLIASLYGISSESDIIIAASKIPFLFFDMTLGSTIFTVFIPIFNKYIGQKNKDAAFKFANNFITIIMIFTIILSILGIIFSKQIINLIVPNFNLEKKIYTTKILSILFPSVIFTSISFVLAAILQSFGNFTISSIMSLISNLFIITYLILFKKKYGLIGVALSMLIGWNLQFIIQIPSIQKTCFKYKFFFDLKNSAIIESFKMSYYVLISSWIQPLCYMINMRFASKMGEGTVSSFDLSNNIFLIIVGIFSYSVSNFMFPKISKLNFKKEQEKFSKIVSKFISFILYIISFISSIFLSFPHQIIKIVYARGNFDEYSSKITAISLFYLNFGMIASAVCEILNKSFYAVKNGIIPMISSILGIITNFILMLFFVIFLKLKIIGISLSTALSIVVSAIYLIFSFHKNIKFFNLQKLILNLTKIFLCNLITFLIYNFFYFAIEKICSKNFISLKIILSSTFGLIIYLGLSEIFKIEEFIEIKRYFRRKIND